VITQSSGGENMGRNRVQMRRVDNDRTPHKARLAFRCLPKATAVSHPIIFTTLIEQLLSKHHLHSEGREGVYC
jgi:hypothetical protein